MYTERGIARYRKIISAVVISVCILTMFLSWVHFGIRTSDGEMMDLNTVLDEFGSFGYDIDDIVDEFRDLDVDDYLPDYAITKSEVRELKSVRKAVVRAAKALKDSKLTPVETAGVCVKIGRVVSFLEKYGIGFRGDSDVSAAPFFAVGAVLWLLILLVAVLGGYCVYAELAGKKAPYVGVMCVYLIQFLLYLIVTIYVNPKMKDVVEDWCSGSIIGSCIRSEIDTSAIMRIRFAPILGSVLLVANFIFLEKNKTDALDRVGTEIGNLGRKMVWKCDCGSVNTTASMFCPKCGKRRPAEVTPLDFKTDIADRIVWICTCGNTNPKKNVFCSRCGARQPGSGPAPAYTPPVRTTYCRGCGKPVRNGTEICDECRMRAEAARRARASTRGQVVPGSKRISDRPRRWINGNGGRSARVCRVVLKLPPRFARPGAARQAPWRNPKQEE